MTISLYVDEDRRIKVSEIPSECGTCHKNVAPTYLTGTHILSSIGEGTSMELVFKCTNKDCKGLIIGYYTDKDDPNGHYHLKKIAPISPTDEFFNDEIAEVSENFVHIYNQAFHAEQTNLDLISGIGYRKALEFLVKDYLIYLNPDEEQKILEKQLNPCINMLDNHNIKEIARRAAWLGNDEAHYMRKWEDKDISDLKKLIEVTVYFIAMDVSAKKYLEEMK